MAIRISCSSCRRQYRLRETARGRTVRCQHCGAAITIPQVDRRQSPSGADRSDSPPRSAAVLLFRGACGLIAIAAVTAGLLIYRDIVREPDGSAAVVPSPGSATATASNALRSSPPVEATESESTPVDAVEPAEPDITADNDGSASADTPQSEPPPQQPPRKSLSDWNTLVSNLTGAETDRFGRVVDEKEAVIELTTPAGSEVEIENRSLGEFDLFTVQGVSPDRFTKKRVTVRFDDGAVANRDVLVRGGHMTRLAVTNPSIVRPEIVVAGDTHSTRPYAVEFSPDGRLLATSGGNLIVWDTLSGTQLWSRPPAEGNHGILATFSSDGSRLVTIETGRSPQFSVWDISTGEQEDVRSLPIPGQGTRVREWTSDQGEAWQKLRALLAENAFAHQAARRQTSLRHVRDVIVGAAGDKQFAWRNDTYWDLKLVEVTSGRVALRIKPPRTPNDLARIDAWRVSPNGKEVVVRWSHDVVSVYDLESSEQVAPPDRRCTLTEPILFGPDGSWILSYGHDSVELLDVRTLRPVRRIAGEGTDSWHQRNAHCFALSSDGRLLAAGLGLGTRYESHPSSVTIWDTASGAVMREALTLPGRPELLQFSPDASRLCIVLDDGRILLNSLDSSADRVHAEITDEHTGKFQRVCFDEDGTSYSLIATRQDPDRPHLTADITISELELSRNRGSGFRLERRSGQLQSEAVAGTATSIAASPDGRWIAVGISDNFNREDREQPRVIIYDRSSLGIRHALTDTVTGIARTTRVRFDGNGRLMSAVASGPNVRFSVWEAETGTLLRAATCRTDDDAHASCLAIARDGTRILAGCGDVAVLWDAVDGRELARFPTVTKAEPRVFHVAFRNDAKRILVAEARIVRIWNTEVQGAATSELRAPIVPVDDLQLSDDGQTLLALAKQDSGAARILVWDLARGEPVFETSYSADSRHENLHAWISPDGTRVLITLRNHEAEVWDVRTRKLLFRTSGRISVNWRGGLASPFTSRGDLLQIGDGLFCDAWTGDRINLLPDELIEAPGHRSRQFRTVQAVGNGEIVFADHTAAERNLCVFQPQDQEVLARFSQKPAMDNGVGSDRVLAVSPAGRYVATGHSSTVLLFDVSSGQRRPLEHTKHPRARTGGRYDRPDTRDAQLASVYELEFSADGSRLLARSYSGGGSTSSPTGGGAVIWNVATGQQLMAGREGDNFRQVQGGMSVDGRVVLLAKPPRRRVHEPSDRVYFEPTGVVLCHVETGEILREYPVDVSARLSPDGRKVLCSGPDGTARIHDVLSGDELGRLVVLHDGWTFVTNDGLFDASLQGRKHVFFQFGEDLAPLPLDRYFSEYYYPGLLAAVWNGQRPTPGTPPPRSRAPSIRMLANVAEGGDHSTAEFDVAVVDEGAGVSEPWLVHNGKRAAPGALRHQHGQTQVWRFRLALAEGENRVEAHASTSDGSLQGHPAILSMRHEGLLARPRLHLLAVGINRYREHSGVSNLDLCVSDAEALVNMFRSRTKGLYEDVRVTSLFDEQATRANILSALGELVAHARPQDAIVVYFACHGLTVGQRFYVIPHEFELAEARPPAAPDRNETEASGATGIVVRGNRQQQRLDQVRHQGLAIDQLADQLARIPASKRVLIFDTCQSGGATQLAGRPVNAFGFRGAVERAGTTQGVYVLAATAADELAAESRELGHSLLTYALLASVGAVPAEQLTRPPLVGSGPVDVLEWFRNARQTVPLLYERYVGRPQQIEMTGMEPGFPLLTRETVEVAEEESR